MRSRALITSGAHALLAALLSGVALCLLLLAPAHADEDVYATIAPSFIKEDLYCASFVSPDEGWVVGTFGSIYHTSDGGQSWAKERTGILSPLFSVSFADATHGWAVGKAGVILHTEDGGRTWRKQSAPVGKHLFAVDAVSPTTAWAVGDWGVILTTSDGGTTWQDRSLTEDVILYGVDFADEQYGWIVGEVGNLMVTEDGGQTWKHDRTTSGKSLFGVHVSGHGSALAVGLDGEIWRLAGDGWEQRKSPATAALYDVTMEGSTAWAVGDNGTAVNSEDGGETWYAVNVPEDLKLFWMHTVRLTKASDMTQGLIAGANGLLLWIRDGRITRN
jgi:photosystem II stability/assembly factor-like uncharacterized protein